ncbi:hypothetical protein Plhal304r1_c009g0034431 [Plasmopara halstedii]
MIIRQLAITILPMLQDSATRIFVSCAYAMIYWSNVCRGLALASRPLGRRK